MRAIKAAVDDPRRLVQIDDDGHPYQWLINTADDDQRSVDYTVSDG